MPADRTMEENQEIVKKFYPSASMEQSDTYNCYMVTDPLRGYAGPSGRSKAHAWEVTAQELLKEQGQ